MDIGILGTGIVGTTLGTHLINKGHQVMVGSRSATNEDRKKWVQENKAGGTIGLFNEAATFGDIVFNCTLGIASIQALQLAGIDNLDSKILVDVANPLDFSVGMPPRLTICNDNSLGEEIQKLLPKTKVVKALNTINYEVMVNPKKINNGNIDLFLCGNDTEAKETVTDLLVKEMSWNRENVIDLGDILHARSTESMMLFFVSLAMKYGTFYNCIRIFRA